VVIEGVETHAQLELVRTIGCDLVQGFLLSRPIRAEALQLLLTAPEDYGIEQAAA
jgi:EAL domain-containing protein (putative c-di-GMP-specific phosphodiesterase class I)